MHREGDGSLQPVTHASLRSHSSILKSGAFKTHFWALTLACGHEVERWIRWLPERDGRPPRRGWAAQHHAPGLSRLPDPPKRARCREAR